MTRDRFATRAAILDSAALLIASTGPTSLGVNSLAVAAKCDKVLIYRYFGGLNGVLEAVGAERMLWPRVELEGNGDESLADAMQALLLEEWAALSGSTLMLAAAGAELVPGGEELGGAAATQRAELHTRMLTALREKYQIPPYVDLPALVELLSAALTTLALRAAHASPGPLPAQSFDPASPQGWRRVEKMLATVTRALLDPGSR